MHDMFKNDIIKIREATGIDKHKRTTIYHDLNSLAGTWTTEDEAAFSTAIPPLEAIDPDLCIAIAAEDGTPPPDENIRRRQLLPAAHSLRFGLF